MRPSPVKITVVIASVVIIAPAIKHATAVSAGPSAPSTPARISPAGISPAEISPAEISLSGEPKPGKPLAIIELPPTSAYSDDIPVGFVRTVRTVKTVQDGDLTVTTRSVVTYRRRPRPLPASVIEIPSLHLQAPLFEGVSQWAMSHGPGHFPGMANPGEPGNCGIAAHSNVPGCDYFRGLHRLRAGSLITVRTAAGRFSYTVVGMHIVRPTNVSDLRPTPYPRLTLVTCALPDTRYRLVVIATARANSPSAGVQQAALAAPAQMPVAGRTK